MRVDAFFYCIIIALFVSCSDEVLPKPKAQLRLEYPENSYQRVTSGCPFVIEISQSSQIEFTNNCWAQIHYPTLNATMHLTYREIESELNTVLKEVEKLTYEHAVKADAINAVPYQNDVHRVYGKLINVEGNVASNLQFHVTDSVKNVLYGSLYFNVKPNYDSILPAIKYIEKDIRNLVESVEWKN